MRCPLGVKSTIQKLVVIIIIVIIVQKITNKRLLKVPLLRWTCWGRFRHTENPLLPCTGVFTRGGHPLPPSATWHWIEPLWDHTCGKSVMTMTPNRGVERSLKREHAAGTQEGGSWLWMSESGNGPYYQFNLKTLDTIDNCQRPVFSLGVSQHMHKITNLWKFELNWLSKLWDNNERKKHPCHTKLCAFRCLISRPQILNLRSPNQICGKILLSRKLLHFRGSHFSQCFILSTSPHYLVPSKGFMQINILSNYQ